MEYFPISDIAGIVGAATYLGSYAALQMGLMRGQGYAYASLNTFAASCVLISMINAFNFSSALIQVSWIVISVFGISRYYIATHRVRFSEEERQLLAQGFPTLDKYNARKVLSLGSWHMAEPNTVLTEAGLPVPYLIYLLRGSASVLVNGHRIAEIGADTFIGEMTAMSGDPATATVVLDQPSRYFAIPSGLLRNVIKRDEALKREIDIALSKAVRDKLVRSNQLRTANE